MIPQKSHTVEKEDVKEEMGNRNARIQLNYILRFILKNAYKDYKVNFIFKWIYKKGKKSGRG